MGASSVAPLLAACGSGGGSTSSGGGASNGGGSTPKGPGGIALARPNHPVTLPLDADNKAIPSGMKPETGGTFTVFNYFDYLDKQVLTDFGKKYGVNVQLSTFDGIDQGIAKLASGSVRPDVTEMTPDKLAEVVAGKLLAPINHSYIPNLPGNVLPNFQSPFYDVGARYTVPYTMYTTGIFWRSDKVTQDIPSMSNPWEIFWKSQAYKGFVGVLDEPRETIALALLRRGITDINTEDPKLIAQAGKDLEQLSSICNVKVNETSYQDIPQGRSWLHHAWSGDPILAVNDYLPKGFDRKLLRYWHAPKGHGPIQNDCWGIVKGTQKPVLAHLWLNYILDDKVGYDNFVNYTGYQPPLKSVTPDTLVSKGIVPETLRSAVITENDFGPTSLQEMTLTPAGLREYQNAYSQFVSGV
ncbi:MAG TPA: spermidine/putrescine ABC transporter substrate-binding protein [Solirubrobacteraceae bacterium]|jgi:spermidine/putrescine transport system substrate-binding protein|nr:spermidine/putrescine ABC transporter substrate-binding protein [Solirubrobacteraceae bacterium]